jgi:hypothetical protein
MRQATQKPAPMVHASASVPPRLARSAFFRGMPGLRSAHLRALTFAFPSLMPMAESIVVRTVIAKDLARGGEAGILLCCCSA